MLYPELDFGIKPYGSHTRAEFLDPLLQLVFEQEFANAGEKTYHFQY